MTFSLEGVGAVDAWINPNLRPPSTVSRDVAYLFKGLMERYERGTTLSQLIDEMDEAGVAKAVLCAGYTETEEDLDWVRAAIDKYPDRFCGSYAVDPHLGMATVRLIERLVSDEGFRLIRIIGLFTQISYDDARNYPIYAKCAELDVPVGVNVGIPGPLVPGKHQHPLALDEVCAFFPELKLVMQHGGEPWVDLCVKLLLKWPNLHYMTSAFAPKHLPAQIIQYVNTRGADKVMFASDYPLLALDRCMREAAELPFRDQERFEKFVARNAEALFFP